MAGVVGPRLVSIPLLLDLYPNASVAYSLRKLRKAYTGDCIRVRRSNDNAEQNIGFVNNVLDTASLLSFVGANNGFVTTWYDQSGAGLNVTQTIASRQPLITDSNGNLFIRNGKPKIFFNRSNNNTLTSSFTALGSQQGSALYVEFESTEGAIGVSRTIFMYGVGSGGFSNNSTIGALVHISGTGNRYDFYTANSNPLNIQNPIDTNRHIVGGFYRRTEGVVRSYNRGSVISTQNRNTSVTSQSIIRLGSAANDINFNVSGYFGEAVMYLGDNPDNSVEIQANQEFFYG